MPAITFTGIASGFDSNSIIDSLVAAEKAPAQTIQAQQSATQSQLSTLGALMSRLQALGDDVSAWTGASATAPIAASSSSAAVAASVSGGATPGTYQVGVDALAQAQTSESEGYASSDAGVAGAGSLSITVGTNPPITVEYGTTDSLSDIAASINKAAGSAANAQVIYDGSRYHIVIDASATGTANALTLGDSGAGLGFTTVNPAGDAQLTVNGVHITRSSNDVSDVIPGLTLSLTSTTPSGQPALVQVKNDTQAAQSQVQKMVEDYNAIASGLSSQLSYTGTTKGPDTLFGDSGLERLQQDLSSVFAQTFGSGAAAPGDLGITLAKDGTLSLDASKLQSALAADPQALTKLLAGPSGLAKAVSNVTTSYGDPTQGILAGETTARQSLLTSYATEIQTIDDHAAQLGDQLRTQFAQLDQIETEYQRQLNYINAVFGGSSSSSNKSSSSSSSSA